MIARWLQSLGMPGAARALLRLHLAFNPRSVQAMSDLLALEISRRDRSAAARLCERLLETDPEHPDALREMADMRLKQDDPHGAAEYFNRLHGSTSRDPTIIKVCRMALLDPKRYRAGAGYVARVGNVLVDTGYWAVLQEDRVYYVETHQRQFEKSPLVRWRVTKDRQYYIVSHSPPSATIDAPCILLGGDENYSHWVTRNMLKLSLLENNSHYDQLPYLINDDLRRHQSEYLDLLGIPGERLIPVPPGRVIGCRDLTVPTVVYNRADMRQAIEWLRARLQGPLASAGKFPGLLFVSRRDSPRRVLLNEAELERELAPLGFTTIVPGMMPVRDQIAAFAGARIIVAPHGAALANLIYAPADALVVHITSTNIEHMDDFRVIAKAMGQTLVSITSDEYEVQNATVITRPNFPYRANVRDVLAVLREEGGLRA